MAGDILHFYEAFYLDEILYCCKSVENSFKALNVALVANHKDCHSKEKGRGIKDTILREAQNLIGHAASLSKLLWPPSTKGKYERRGKKLRAALGITEESPLKCRLVRNAMEHFDERLDDYLAKGMFGIIFPKYVGEKPGENEPTHHLFRAFFTDVGEFEILGENIPLQPLVDEVMRIGNSLVTLNSKGGRLPVGDE